jgi:hypothetical protein
MTLGENVVMQLVTNLIVNCPLFLALVVGFVVGIAAFVRNSRPAGCLALIGFVVLGTLLLLSTFLGGGRMAAFAYERGMAVGQIDILSTLVGCVRSLVEMVGLLCIVGAVAVYAFQAREPAST